MTAAFRNERPLRSPSPRERLSVRPAVATDASVPGRPMPTPTLRGRFVWHELTTTDPDAAARFYPGVTGWKVQAWEQDPSYRLWMTGSVLRGGLMRLPQESRRLGAPPSWLMYVGVPDVDASVRQATSLGARTLAPPRPLPAGRFAVPEAAQAPAAALAQP